MNYMGSRYFTFFATKRVFVDEVHCLLKFCLSLFGCYGGLSVNCVQDYATALDLLQELILCTDVAEHLKVIRQIEQMVEGADKFVVT